jgi:DNA polymerase-4
MKPICYQNKKGNPSASILAEEIRLRIFNEVGLTASAGISVNKFVQNRQ